MKHYKLIISIILLIIFSFNNKVLADDDTCKVSFTTQPVNRTARIGDSVSFSIVASGINLLYQWQVAYSGVLPFINIDSTNSYAEYSGYNTATLLLTGVVFSNNGYRYRCKVFKQLPCIDTIISNEVILTVTRIGFGSWIGIISSDWNTPGNWDVGYVPYQNEYVWFQSTAPHQPVINRGDSGLCKDIIIYPGASLTVIGNLKCNGNLLIKSDATGTGAFVQSDAAIVTITGNTTVEKYILSPGYYDISSPVTGLRCDRITGFTFPPSPICGAGCYYNPDNPFPADAFPNIFRIVEAHTHDIIMDYNSWYAPSGYEVMPPAVGYIINMPLSGKISFTRPGTNLNSGNYQYTVSKEALSTDTYHNNKILDIYGNSTPPLTGPLIFSGTGPTNGLHLVGNPYPSPIDWDAIVSAGIPGDITHTIAMFNPTAQYYVVYGYYNPYYGAFGTFRPSQYIPSAQSFYILNSVVSTPELTFKNAYRIEANPKSNSKKINFPLLRLTSQKTGTPPDNIDEAIILFTKDANAVFDKRYDFYKLITSSPTFSNIYSINNAKNYAAKAFPVYQNNFIVSLGFSVNTNGTHTINTTEILNFTNATSIYLIDSTLHKKQNLKIYSQYSFTANTTDAEKRFYLYFIGNLEIYQLQGFITYDNKNNSPIINSKVFLKNSEDIIIDSAVTDTTGFYKFNDLKNGNYTIEPIIKFKWGGVNPVDALMINRSYIGIYSFSDDIMKAVADVSGDGKRNPTDALMVNRRYIGILKQYKAPDWYYEKPVITISGSDVNQNIKVICTGDVNGSYDF